MASRIVRNPVVQTAAKRQMSQVAVAKPAEAAVSKPEGLKMTKLKNGLTVASIETHGPVATLGIVVKCGPRNETYQNAGVSHTIRIAAGLGTKHFTPFGITKNLQQMGASLVVTQGRETTTYTVQATRDQVDLAMEYLAEVVGSQMFKPWELGDSWPRMKVELGLVPPATLATELLHQAAFRTGLGWSGWASLTPRSPGTRTWWLWRPGPGPPLP